MEKNKENMNSQLDEFISSLRHEEREFLDEYLEYKKYELGKLDYYKETIEKYKKRIRLYRITLYVSITAASVMMPAMILRLIDEIWDKEIYSPGLALIAGAFVTAFVFILASSPWPLQKRRYKEQVTYLCGQLTVIYKLLYKNGQFTGFLANTNSELDGVDIFEHECTFESEEKKELAMFHCSAYAAYEVIFGKDSGFLNPENDNIKGELSRHRKRAKADVASYLGCSAEKCSPEVIENNLEIIFKETKEFLSENKEQMMKVRNYFRTYCTASDQDLVQIFEKGTKTL